MSQKASKACRLSRRVAQALRALSTSWRFQWLGAVPGSQKSYSCYIDASQVSMAVTQKRRPSLQEEAPPFLGLSKWRMEARRASHTFRARCKELVVLPKLWMTSERERKSLLVWHGLLWSDAFLVGCILRRGFCVKVRRMFGTTRSFARESLKAAGRVAVGRWTGTGHEVPLSWLHPCPWGFVGAGAPQPRSWRDAVPQYMLIGGPVELTRVLFVAIVRTDASVSIAWDRSSTARPQAKSQ